MKYFTRSHAMGGEIRLLGKRAMTAIGCLALMAELVVLSTSSSAATSPAGQTTPSWTLSTDDTLLTISIEDGRPAMRVLRSKVTDDNWLHASSKERLMETVEDDGSIVKTDWKFQSANLDETNEQLTLHFVNAEPRLALNSIWRGRRGPGPVEHWLTIVNDSGHTLTVTRQDSLVLDGLTLAPQESADLWWINRGGSNASLQGGTFVVKADAELDQVLTSDPVDASSPVPWLAVQAGTQ